MGFRWGKRSFAINMKLMNLCLVYGTNTISMSFLFTEDNETSCKNKLSEARL